MSVHCGICGSVDNWREDVEVIVDDKTWIVLRAYKDPLTGSKARPFKKAIDYDVWVHRDCWQRQLEHWEVSTKINYTPKRADNKHYENERGK